MGAAKAINLGSWDKCPAYCYDFFFPSIPVLLSRIIHHSHSFTRLEINHHIYFIYHTFDIQILASSDYFFFPSLPVSLSRIIHHSQMKRYSFLLDIFKTK